MLAPETGNACLPTAARRKDEAVRRLEKAGPEFLSSRRISDMGEVRRSNAGNTVLLNDVLNFRYFFAVGLRCTKMFNSVYKQSSAACYCASY